jgi:hypothetical protein
MNIIFFFQGLGRLTCSDIDALPSFPGASTIKPERSQTKRDKLVLQEWGFCGWAGNPLKENKIFTSKDAQPWISADQM